MDIKYCELTELKEELNKRGIKYNEQRPNGGILLYVNGLMQIQKPTKEQLKRFWPYVRISWHEGDPGYYIKHCGIIHNNQTLEKVIDIIEKWIRES